MSTSYHMGLDVRGALRNGAWKRALVGTCRDEATGRLLTANEIFDELVGHVARGEFVIPYGDCDNWDFNHGCRGHVKENDGATNQTTQTCHAAATAGQEL